LTKPGWRTTEFWLTVVQVLIATLVAASGEYAGTQLARVAAVLVAGLSTIAYTLTRGRVKTAGGGAGD
jgi:hypothetical protein